MKTILLICLFGLQACSEAGLLPTSGGGGAVTVPRVILNCQTANCRTNATAPLINIIITTSSCADPLFGGTLSSSTRSISCNGSSGCYGEINGWVTNSGSTNYIQAGTYNICACIDYTATHTPWVNCNSLGSANNVSISSSTGLQMISSWIDQ